MKNIKTLTEIMTEQGFDLSEDGVVSTPEGFGHSMRYYGPKAKAIQDTVKAFDAFALQFKPKEQ